MIPKLCLLFFLQFIFLNGEEWRVEDQINHPSQRGAATMDTINRKFILFGGYNECFDATVCDNEFFNEVWQYHVDFNTWYKGNPADPIPQPRGFIAADHYVLNNSVIYFGGGNFNATATVINFFNDTWEYFPEQDIFVQRIPQNTGPSKRLGPELVILGHNAYVFGGIDETFTYRNDLWKYNLLTDKWTLLIPNGMLGSPDARSSPQMQLRVTPNTRTIIVFGGDAPPAGAGLQKNDTWIYHIGNNSWESTPAIPGNKVGRVYGGSAFYNDKFIISLGDIKDDEKSCRTSEASGGQLPTNGTYYLNFNDKGSPSWDYEFARTERPPKLKRVAYTQFEKKLWIWGGYDFVCPCNQTSGFPVWNTDLYYLNIDHLTD
jgi:N-acetylneuraminic acid mutarotase